MQLEQQNIFGNSVPLTGRKPKLTQSKSPCPVCGSYYRRGTLCNVCELDLKEPPDDNVLKKKREFFQHGRFYSKTKKHRR